MHKSKNAILFVFIFVMIIVITIAGLRIYYNDLQKDLQEQAHHTLDEVLAQQRFNFKNEMDAQLEILTTNATIISSLGGNNESILSAINEIAAKTKFDFLIIANPQGMSINSDGQVVDMNGRPHFERAIKGETFIPEPIKSLISDDMIIPISTPIFNNGEIVGVLIGSFSTQRFNELLLPSFNGMGYAFVINSKGDIIAKTENDNMLLESDNLFQTFTENNAEFYEFDNLDTILEKVKQSKSGRSNYKIGKEKRIAHYSPVGVNDWCLFAAVPEKVVSKNAENITEKAGGLVTAIICSFAVLISYIFIIQGKSAKMKVDNISRLETIAYVDQLTGVRNYNKFKIDAQKILQNSSNAPYAIAKIDVENFKLINKVYGFEMGDRILKTMSVAIGSYLHEEDGEIFARIVSDEFIVLSNFRGQKIQIENYNNSINKFYELMGKDFNYKVKFKLGQYVIKKELAATGSINEFFEMANFAHMKAKKSTNLDIAFYDEDMSREVLHQKEMENQMERALLNEEFVVYLQPKYSLNDETICGAEALARWQPENGDMIYPNEFIPLFEKNGFITKLDMYMLKKVCSIINEWIKDGLNLVTVSVNFSRLHLNNGNFVDDICKIVDSCMIPHNLIEIEITETAIFEKLNDFKEILLNLHNAGFTMSIDDFGSGYSSLGLLKNLPVDVIKIDRSFFTNWQNEYRTRAVISNIIRMANELSMISVAEGVEDKAHVDLLREVGCDIVQGYYYAKPMPEEEFSKRLNLNVKPEEKSLSHVY